MRTEGDGMKKMADQSKRFIFSFLIILFTVFFLSSCGEIPKTDDFTVSKLVDLKMTNYKPTEFEFSNVPDFLNKDSVEGNMITIVYSGKNNHYAKLVSAHTTKSKGVYYVWRAFAKENNALFKSSFTSIPFVMGTFKHQEKDIYVESWFKEKWFFYIESDSSEELETIRIQLIEFFENPDVINESVIDL